MSTLLKFALESKFGKNINAQEVIDVAEATGNSTVAVEKILGIYKEPDFLKEITNKTYSRDGDVCVFVSHDPFREEIKYSFLEKKSATRYFNREELKKALGLKLTDSLYSKKEHVEKFPELFFSSREKFEALNPGKSCDYNSFPIGDLVKKERTMSVRNWVND